MERLWTELIEVLIGCKSANCVCEVKAEQQTQHVTCASILSSTYNTNKVYIQSPHLSHTLAMITMHKHTQALPGWLGS